MTMKTAFLNVAFIALLVLSTSLAAAQRVDTIRFRVDWEVVEGRHPAADSLGELSGIAIDAAGIVYASDFSAAKIWVFDRAGRSLPGIGRKGQGPGEFDAPTGLAIGPNGRLFVRDLNRVTTFESDPATGRLTKYERVFQGPLFADWRSKTATRFDAAGRLYYPAFNTVGRTRRTGYYIRYSLAGELVDSVEVPAFPNAPSSTASIRLSARGGRMLPGLNHVPFAPMPTWDVSPRGTLILGMGDSYVLRERTFDGSEIRTYQRVVGPERIPARQRADSTAALRARLDSVPVPLDRVEGMPADVRSLRLPQVFPAFMAAYAASDGRIWVRRWSSSNGQSVFDVFEPDGRYRAVIMLPRFIAVEPTPVLSLDVVAGIGVNGETGANTIVKFAVTNSR
jgi:hypothetical protein